MLKQIFGVILGFVLLMDGLTLGPASAWAYGDSAPPASVNSDLGARYKVLYASNAHITDKKGQSLGQIEKSVVLEGQDVTVDLGGTLILEAAGTASGEMRLMQNSKASFRGDKVVMSQGELVCRSLKNVKVDLKKFEVGTLEAGKSVSAYFFTRDKNSFVTTGPDSAAVNVTAPSSQIIELKPLKSAMMSEKQGLKAHSFAPRKTLFAMSSLKSDVMYLKSDKKSKETIKIIYAKDVEVAVPSSGDSVFKTAKVGERYVLQPQFAETLVRLKNKDARLAIEYFEGKKKRVMNFDGKMLFSLYSSPKSTGGKK